MPTFRPTWFDWITVAAIIVGPVLALFAQRVLDLLRERKKERKQLFNTLMTTRHQLYSPAHLQALNSIDIVFKDNERICAAWKAVLDYAAMKVDESDAKALADWSQRLLDLRAKSLGRNWVSGIPRTTSCVASTRPGSLMKWNRSGITFAGVCPRRLRTMPCL
jgi:uncharacterized protein DUF6680